MRDDDQWAKLVGLLGHPPELQRPELADRPGRAAAHDEIDAAIAGWTAGRSKEELQLSAALDRMPANYQEVILLRNLQRLPFDEVARRMERSRPAVQMLWMRAIKRLQQAMTDQPADDSEG